jgi:steroid delta-isomerase-like uncharacterized protein
MNNPAETAQRYDEAFNAKDANTRAALLSDDTEVLLPTGPSIVGREQVLELARGFWEALPDVTISSDFEVAHGDAVVTEGVLRGTHTGTFRTPQGDVPASGNPVSFRYVSIKWIRSGRLVREHLYFDQLGFFQQIGALPASDRSQAPA